MTGDIRGLRIGILRHLYEEDLTVAPEVRAALDEAYAVFRSLGATLEDVRIRPAADYYAVKITIAESEQYAIHEEELRTRPSEFGADFLGRALPAILYSSSDYVQAQRERRLMLAEMAPIYAKYDRAADADGAGPGAAARRLAHDPVLAAGVADDAVQRHRRPGARPMHGLHDGGLAAVAADRRPPVRRSDGVARRARLRKGDGLAPAQARPRSGSCLLDRTAAEHPD